MLSRRFLVEVTGISYPLLTFTYHGSRGSVSSALLSPQRPENHGRRLRPGFSQELLQGDQVEVDDGMANRRGINLVGPGVDLGLDLFDALGAESAGRLGKYRELNAIGARARRRSRAALRMRRGRRPNSKAFVCWLNPHNVG